MSFKKMKDLYRELASISTTKFYYNLFTSLDAGTEYDFIQLYENILYIGQNYSVDINTFKNIEEAYIEIVKILSRNIDKVETWNTIKENIKQLLIDNFIKEKTEKFKFNSKQISNLETFLNIILHTNDVSNIVYVLNNKIDCIYGLKMIGDNFYVEGYNYNVLSKNKNVKVKKDKNLFNKANNKFIDSYIKKFDSCN